MNIAVFSSHDGSNLQAVIDACQSGVLNAKVCAVISNNRGSFALERAKAAGIPHYVFNLQSAGSEEALESGIYAALMENRADVILLAGYLKKLGPRILSAWPDRIFNIHPALLPKYGGKGMYGMNVHRAVIDAGEKFSGVTIHRVNGEYDGGETLTQMCVPVLEGDTPETLAARVLECEHTLLVETLEHIIETVGPRGARTLYVSDLDGTLLNQDGWLSDFTAWALGKLMAKGIHFSVATARTKVSTMKILDGISFNLPIVLMNGALVYDTQSGVYLKKETLPAETVKAVIRTLKARRQTGFMYGLTGDGDIVTYYENLDHPPLKAFYDERTQKYYKSFVRADNFLSAAGNDIFYFTFMDSREKMEELDAALQSIPGLDTVRYRDNYAADLWLVECCSAAASKYNGVKFLREQYGFDRVVSFGDNTNDLPMFAASDESYAVENAAHQVIEKATGVIGSNFNDAVAKWLLENA